MNTNLIRAVCACVLPLAASIATASLIDRGGGRSKTQGVKANQSTGLSRIRHVTNSNMLANFM